MEEADRFDVHVGQSAAGQSVAIAPVSSYRKNGLAHRAVTWWFGSRRLEGIEEDAQQPHQVRCIPCGQGHPAIPSGTRNNSLTTPFASNAPKGSLLPPRSGSGGSASI